MLLFIIVRTKQYVNRHHRVGNLKIHTHLSVGDKKQRHKQQRVTTCRHSLRDSRHKVSSLNLVQSLLTVRDNGNGKNKTYMIFYDDRLRNLIIRMRVKIKDLNNTSKVDTFSVQFLTNTSTGVIVSISFGNFTQVSLRFQYLKARYKQGSAVNQCLSRHNKNSIMFHVNRHMERNSHL